MKGRWQWVLFLAVVVAAPATAKGQGTFQNLGFESPIGSLVSIYPPGNPPTVPFTNAFPSWVGYVGTNLAEVVRIDGINLDLATLAIVGSNVLSLWFAPLIEGKYTAVLQPQQTTFGGPSPVALVPVALLQTGLVPADAKSLQFKSFTEGTAFTVSLGGVAIPLAPLATFPTYTLYGGDISAFAGTLAELRFTAFPNNYPHSTVFALDSIQFSNQQVPEPGTVGLIGLGALLVGWRWRKT